MLEPNSPIERRRRVRICTVVRPECPGERDPEAAPAALFVVPGFLILRIVRAAIPFLAPSGMNLVEFARPARLVALTHCQPSPNTRRISVDRSNAPILFGRPETNPAAHSPRLQHTYPCEREATWQDGGGRCSPPRRAKRSPRPTSPAPHLTPPQGRPPPHPLSRSQGLDRCPAPLASADAAVKHQVSPTELRSVGLTFATA